MKIELLRNGRGSDHQERPFTSEKFLNKQTMNSKVNNWAVELEQF